MNTHTETLRIEGMTCAHCVRAVREALERLDGVEVEEVRVGAARVRFDAERPSRDALVRDALVRAVEAEGYTVAG